MPNYLRNDLPGGTYFFTVITAGRRSILTSEDGRKYLHSAIERIQSAHSFSIVAVVLLPDHLHTIWTLPQGDADYSLRWGLIKEAFTRAHLETGGAETISSSSRRKHRERGVWQRRFWEHTIRDESDFERCLDYIHWNPVKHGLVPRVRDYPWSSFHRLVKEGIYGVDWGAAEVPEVPG